MRKGSTHSFVVQRFVRDCTASLISVQARTNLNGTLPRALRVSPSWSALSLQSAPKRKAPQLPAGPKGESSCAPASLTCIAAKSRPPLPRAPIPAYGRCRFVSAFGRREAGSRRGLGSVTMPRAPARGRGSQRGTRSARGNWGFWVGERQHY